MSSENANGWAMDAHGSERKCVWMLGDCVKNVYWFGWGFVLAFRIKIEELSAKAV